METEQEANKPDASQPHTQTQTPGTENQMTTSMETTHTFHSDDDVLSNDDLAANKATVSIKKRKIGPIDLDNENDVEELMLFLLNAQKCIQRKLQKLKVDI